MKINHYKGFLFLIASVKSVLNMRIVVCLLRCERSLWAGLAERFVSPLNVENSLSFFNSDIPAVNTCADAVGIF